MYSNINNNQAIVNDSEIIFKLKEMIKEGLFKLKSFVKVKKQSKFESYYELEEKFNAIALKLEEFEFFNEELNYFLLISEEILYIIYQNCKNNSFGHCDFALELFDFFMEIWDAKTELLNNYSENKIKKHNKSKIMFKKRYHNYRRKFYWDIYEYTDDFDESMTYEFAKTLRE